MDVRCSFSTSRGQSAQTVYHQRTRMRSSKRQRHEIFEWLHERSEGIIKTMESDTQQNRQHARCAAALTRLRRHPKRAVTPGTTKSEFKKPAALRYGRTGVAFRFALGLFVVVAVLGPHLTVSAASTGELLTNGDFETGDFRGWTTFTTAHGSLGASVGPPDVVPFGVSGSGDYSQAARFQVGQESFLPNIPEGGGIFQNFASPAGVAIVHANIAADQPLDFINTDPGSFLLYVDGQLLDALAFGSQFGNIGPFATQRATLSGSVSLGAGVHELRILVQRPALNSGTTPFQYVDDVSVSLIPEPSIPILLAAGLLVLLVTRRRPLTCWNQIATPKRRLCSSTR